MPKATAQSAFEAKEAKALKTTNPVYKAGYIAGYNKALQTAKKKEKEHARSPR